MAYLKNLSFCVALAAFILFGPLSGLASVGITAVNRVRSIPAVEMLPLQKNILHLLENKPSGIFSFPPFLAGS